MLNHRMKRVISSTSLAILMCAMLGFIFPSDAPKNPLTRDMVQGAEKLFGLEFTDAKVDSMLDALNDQLNNYRGIRSVHLDNSIPPAILFNPIPVGMKIEGKQN